ncbi:hypothetical protein TNIN_322781 [Trichonephila inaurata madagascariensis]|uniref:Uncharacterized protein n=1 Tax=Trichonephila inaurata madagascariensis TaxID=2747483 RepID=A0A8X6ML68_9ARAC|nr:hypothetical protein TNIN_322781 [Trichonephila inaurata madagascariensis]
MNENKLAKESEESKFALLIYTRVARYGLLRSLAFYTSSVQLTSFLEEMTYHELSNFAYAVNILLGIFRDDFDKILNIEIPLNSEIEYAQFLLARCKLLCLEPTYSNFILVSAFLNNLILTVGAKLKCFRILYITEFCFLVLQKRFFWKLFGSKDEYWTLQKYCDKFHKNFTLDSTLSDLQNTCVGEYWINVVQNCLNSTDVHFPLEDVEEKLYEDEYSNRSQMDCKSKPLIEIESFLFPRYSKRTRKELFCYYCNSKCYNYLAYANQF